MQNSISNLLNAPMHGSVIIYWCLYAALILLLLLPAISFIFHGWAVRRRDILGAFSENAAEYYLRAFHGDYLKQRDATEKLNASQHSTYTRWLKRYYSDLYGRKLFVVPIALCAALGSGLLLLCVMYAIRWLEHLPTDHEKQIVLAILGGYVAVVYDQIYASTCDNLSPTNLYEACLRFVLAVPLAFSLSLVFAPTMSLPMAFLLGALPNKSVLNLARSAINKMVQAKDTDPAVINPLTRLRSVDIAVAERFAAERITTIFQLANSDPVRLAIRTGFNFSYILDCCGQALLWNYVGDRIVLFEKLGLFGVYECRDFWKKLLAKQPHAASLLKELSALLEISPEATANLLEEISENPNTKFQHNTWFNAVRDTEAIPHQEVLEPADEPVPSGV
jgi:hypothetical protein